MAVGVVLTLAWLVMAAPAPMPESPPAIFPVWAHAGTSNGTGNNTGNNTANGTAKPCTALANDYCFQQLLALNQNLARFIDYANGVLNTLIYGFIGLVAFVVATELGLVRWTLEKIKVATNRKVGPDDPLNYERFIPMQEHALKSEDRKQFHERAWKDALADLDQKAKEYMEQAKALKKHGEVELALKAAQRAKEYRDAHTEYAKREPDSVI